MYAQARLNTRTVTPKENDEGELTAAQPSTAVPCELSVAPTISLRNASRDDCRAVWEWNNQSDTRAVSRNTDPIPWDDHVKWFEQRLSCEGSILSVIEYDGVAVGVVSTHKQELRRAAIISIAISTAYRGRGIGASAIRLACKRYADGRQASCVEAWIESINRASEKAFRKAGFRYRFRCREDRRYWHVYRWKPEYSESANVSTPETTPLEER